MRKEAEWSNINRVLTEHTDFNTIEAYKSIRTNIMFSMPRSEQGKVILITSSAPNEGKTTTSINLAITFAQTGAKVIVVDCDLRKARVHKYLGLERLDGVSNVLCGFVELDRAIKYSVRENLDCLTAGSAPPNPAELLETDEFAKLIETLKDRYDYIFIDTPPVTVVTDAIIAMRHANGAVVVVRENFTVYDMLDDTIESIQKTKVKLLGVIMVDCDERAGRYSYYRKTKYKYRYGYRYGYKYRYEYHYGDPVEGEKAEKCKKKQKKSKKEEKK